MRRIQEHKSKYDCDASNRLLSTDVSCFMEKIQPHIN